MLDKGWIIPQHPPRPQKKEKRNKNLIFESEPASVVLKDREARQRICVGVQAALHWRPHSCIMAGRPHNACSQVRPEFAVTEEGGLEYEQDYTVHVLSLTLVQAVTASPLLSAHGWHCDASEMANYIQCDRVRGDQDLKNRPFQSQE